MLFADMGHGCIRLPIHLTDVVGIERRSRGLVVDLSGNVGLKRRSSDFPRMLDVIRIQNE